MRGRRILTEIEVLWQRFQLMVFRNVRRTFLMLKTTIIKQKCKELLMNEQNEVRVNRQQSVLLVER